MKVRDVMVTPVITVSPTTTYEEAAKIMHTNHISGVPVVDDKGGLLGIVSEKDLFRAMFPLYEEYAVTPDIIVDKEAQEGEIELIRKYPVEKYMSRKVITIGPNSPILCAGGLMLAHGLHRLPVVEDKELIGIVTREDIYGTILKKHLKQ
jgi:CBS domain-containing protein